MGFSFTYMQKLLSIEYYGVLRSNLSIMQVCKKPIMKLLNHTVLICFCNQGD